MLNRICQKCGKGFQCYPSLVKKGGGKFCSVQCTIKGKITIRCKHCKRAFQVYPSGDTARFCSSQCFNESLLEKRRPIICDDFVQIPLTRNQIAIVDREDFDTMNLLNKLWIAHWMEDIGGFYASRAVNKKTLLMHRYIMNAGDNVLVNHWDFDTLNNRKSNLVLCTRQENNQYSRKQERITSSVYKGVHLHEGKWIARVSIFRKRIFLGSFSTEIEAAIAYNSAARQYYGDFAKQNEIEHEIF